MLERIFELWTVLKIEATDVAEELLPSNHKRVQAELRRSIASKGECMDDAAWPELHQRVIKAEGWKPDSLVVPPEHMKSLWVSEVMIRREQECLAYAVKKQEMAHPDRTLTSVDTYQNLNRMFYGVNGILNPYLPSARTYHIDEKRFILGEEAMMLQSFPHHILENGFQRKPWDQNMLRKLAGNAFTGTVHMSLLLSMLVFLNPYIPSTIAHQSYEESDDLDAIAMLAKF